MMRLITFLLAVAFLIPLGAVMFLIAGTIDLPSVWLYLVMRVLFTIACVVTMSEEVARERLKPGPKAKPEPIYNIGAGITWVAHFLIVPLDLGRFHWSAGFPTWLQVIGVVVTAGGMSMVVWALRHNEYLSARIRIQEERGHVVANTGPYARIRHPNNAGAILTGLSSGLVFKSWPSVIPLLIWIGLVVYRTLQEEKVLLNELEGYKEYTQQVRFRFIPGLW